MWKRRRTVENKCFKIMNFELRYIHKQVSLQRLLICLLLTDGSRLVPSFVSHPSDWDLDNEQDGMAGRYAHVPGLRKKK